VGNGGYYILREFVIFTAQLEFKIKKVMLGSTYSSYGEKK
jgi:hypothetical protein